MKRVPTVEDWTNHYRAQVNWQHPAPSFWLVPQTGGGGRVEPKIEFVSPIAQDLKRAESQLKDMKKEGEVIPREVIVTKLKPQSKRKTKRKPKKNNKNKKKRTKKVKRLTPKYFWKKV